MEYVVGKAIKFFDLTKSDRRAENYSSQNRDNDIAVKQVHTEQTATHCHANGSMSTKRPPSNGAPPSQGNPAQKKLKMSSTEGNGPNRLPQSKNGQLIHQPNPPWAVVPYQSHRYHPSQSGHPKRPDYASTEPARQENLRSTPPNSDWDKVAKRFCGDQIRGGEMNARSQSISPHEFASALEQHFRIAEEVRRDRLDLMDKLCRAEEKLVTHSKEVANKDQAIRELKDKQKIDQKTISDHAKELRHYTKKYEDLQEAHNLKFQVKDENITLDRVHNQVLALLETLDTGRKEYEQDQNQILSLKGELAKFRQVEQQLPDSDIKQEFGDLEHSIFDLAAELTRNNTLNIPSPAFDPETSGNKCSSPDGQANDTKTLIVAVQKIIWHRVEVFFRTENSFSVTDTGAIGQARNALEAWLNEGLVSSVSVKDWVRSTIKFLKQYPEEWDRARCNDRALILKHLKSRLKAIGVSESELNQDAFLSSVVEDAQALSEKLHEHKEAYIFVPRKEHPGIFDPTSMEDINDANQNNQGKRQVKLIVHPELIKFTIPKGKDKQWVFVKKAAVYCDTASKIETGELNHTGTTAGNVGAGQVATKAQG